MKDKKKITMSRSLMTSLIAVICLIICIFVFLGRYITWKSENAIDEIGITYMAGMNEQLSLHFEAIVDLRLTMVEGIVKMMSEENGSNSILSKEELAYNAKARGFSYLALYSSDGEVEMVTGDTIEVVKNSELFLESLKDGERKVASATDSEGKGVVLFGVPCNYPMSDGSESLAIVMGLSSEDMSSVLFTDSESPLVYCYIIRKDGSYVLRDLGGSGESYFDRLYSIFDDQDADVEEYIEEMTTAMEADEDYSVILKSDTSRRHMYCKSLPYCEWYLVSVLPFDNLDATISDMGRQWLIMVYIACAVSILALLMVFIQYFRIFTRQVKELKEMNRVKDEAREAAEEAKKEAEHANMAKREFLSNMSHDIRTPMNAIVGMTSIAVTNIDNQEQVQECLRKITLSSKHLLGLINDVLDMSKIESGKMTLSIGQVSLREAMDGIVNIVQPQIKAKSQHFNIFIHDILAENVCCDSVRLNQILINLLGNAVKFTPEEGSIQVSLYQEPVPDDDSCIRTHFLVKDTGIGMSEEYQEKIFESFSREDSTRVQKTEGTGLGMAITKYIVDAMGGSIMVESEQGKGSEFHIVLDMKKAEVQEADMVLPAWNMLVVDDDEQLCMSAVSSLQSIGVNPEWCTDAKSAISMVEERHKRHDDYQIILLDWKLPEMSGIEATREIRQRYGSDIPIILVSAYDWSDIEEEAKEAGVTGFISKPLFKSTLFYGIRQFVSIPGEDAPEVISESDHVELKGRHVLLAEDNEINWEVAQALLSSLEMKLDWAENGQICVDRFKASPVGYYDVILMDIRMPVMNGYEATKTIRALEREDAADIPIIAMTADAFSEDVQRCLECGMNSHVAKPIDMQDMCHKLERFLRRDKQRP